MRKGSYHTMETVRKIRHSIEDKSSIIWIMVKLNEVGIGESVELTENLTLWARNRGLNKGALWDMGYTGRKTYRKSHKGWKGVRVDISRLPADKIEVVSKRVYSCSDQKIRNKFNRFKPVYSDKVVSEVTGHSIKEIYNRAMVEASGDSWIASHRGAYKQFCDNINNARRRGATKENLEMELGEAHILPDWYDRRLWKHYWIENP